MSSTTVNFPAYRAETMITDSHRITPEAHRHLLTLYNGQPLQKVDTSAGPANFVVPFAKLNQNVEITFLKVSADANVPTLTAQGSDKINGAAALPMGAAQFTKVKLKSDGVSNWYVTG